MFLLEVLEGILLLAKLLGAAHVPWLMTHFLHLLELVTWHLLSLTLLSCSSIGTSRFFGYMALLSPALRTLGIIQPTGIAWKINLPSQDP